MSNYDNIFLETINCCFFLHIIFYTSLFQEVNTLFEQQPKNQIIKYLIIWAKKKKLVINSFFLIFVSAGVTSFNIDFAAKKVTVVGDVTPVSVLASISKVKNAQFWASGVSSVSPANPNLTTLDSMKQ